MLVDGIEILDLFFFLFFIFLFFFFVVVLIYTQVGLCIGQSKKYKKKISNIN